MRDDQRLRQDLLALKREQQDERREQRDERQRAEPRRAARREPPRPPRPERCAGRLRDDDRNDDVEHDREQQRAHGTVIADRPSSSATIGAKANDHDGVVQRHLDRVKCGSPSVSLLQTNTMAVHGAAARMISPAM